MKRDTSSLFQHLSKVQAALEAEVVPVSGGLSGGAFLELDPVLMQIAKQRAQANKDYQRLSRDGMFGEAMAEVARAQVAHLEQLYAQRLAMLQNQRKADVLNRDKKHNLAARRAQVAMEKSQAAAQMAREEDLQQQKKAKERKEFWWLLVVILLLSKPFEAPRLTPA